MNPNEIDQFLDTLPIGRRSRYTYVGIVRPFQLFVLEQRPVDDEPLSTETLRAWLKREVARSPLSAVIGRTCLIARYLDWRTGAGADHGNPMAELRRQYGLALSPIIRALLEDDYLAALERLRPLPDFGSFLGEQMREHVVRMQSLGYRYETRARHLRRFDRFLQCHPDLVGQPLSALLEAWRDSNPGARHQLCVQQCGRSLSQALHRLDAATTVLSLDIGLQRKVLRQERRPYLYTEDDIQRLFDAARSFTSERAPLRPITLCTMLALAYCTGLRLGEIAALTLADVHLDDGTIEIRDTKFFKSRRLPLAPGVIGLLSQYLEARAAASASTAPEAGLFWSPLRRHRYSYSMISKLLVSVIRRAGLKPDPGRRGPRIHDLRHAFVAHRMLQWYRDGVDVQSRLPHLATYLGHKDIRSTLVYLHVTRDLLLEAGERFRQYGVEALNAPGEKP